MTARQRTTNGSFHQRARQIDWAWQQLRGSCYMRDGDPRASEPSIAASTSARGTSDGPACAHRAARFSTSAAVTPSKKSVRPERKLAASWRSVSRHCEECGVWGVKCAACKFARSRRLDFRLSAQGEDAPRKVVDTNELVAAVSVWQVVAAAAVSIWQVVVAAAVSVWQVDGGMQRPVCSCANTCQRPHARRATSQRRGGVWMGFR
eukprot:352399-Chlamydomonas_euryale.AAC.8